MKRSEIRVKINSSNWNIVLTDNKQDLIDRDGHLCKGTTSYKKSTIYISNEVSRENLAHLLRHELTHVYLYETQIRLTDNYSEEDMCEFIAIYGKRIIKKADTILRRVGR